MKKSMKVSMLLVLLYISNIYAKVVCSVCGAAERERGERSAVERPRCGCTSQSRHPQLPEINDRYETTNSSATIKTNDTLQRNITVEENEIITSELRIRNTTSERRDDLTDTTMVSIVPIHTKFYRAICAPIDAFFSAPKVIVVLRNIGTCIVNGAMELISFYLPAPLIPLIASAAGMVIPFEPVVMLRDKMPVNSYRRAFMSAMNSFLGTFDKYKIDDNVVDDPYMMQRFSRRFMNDPPKGKEVKVDEII